MKNRPWSTLTSALLAGLVLGLILISCTSEKKPSIYEELLKLVPDTSATRSEVYINDYALVRKLFDIPLPGENADEEALAEYLRALRVAHIGKEDSPRLGKEPFISGFNQYSEHLLEMRRYLGFDFTDVEQSVLAGAPPGMLEIIHGQFDPQSTEQALKACTECPESTRQDYQGISFYSWGEDYMPILKESLAPPAFDHLGRGGRIAVQERYVFRTVETPGMRALLSRSQGSGDSLMDVNEFKLLAKGLSRLKPFTVFLSDRTQAIDELAGYISETETPQEELEAIKNKLKQSSPLLRPYQAFAMGQGKDNERLYMALILVHPDEKSAQDNASLLHQRIMATSSVLDEMTSTKWVEDVEIEVDGRLLLAKLRGSIAIGWAEWFFQRDPLIIHE